MRSGRLIVLEGAEGAGKTTQLKLLADRLRAARIDTLTLREPGGTPVGDAIRGILLDPSRQISATTEALLFMASRSQVVSDEIDPALGRGVVVLMDRFFLSTYAYQIHGRGLPEDQIRSANALAASGLIPDLTIVIQMPSAEGMSRAGTRGAHDRMEQSGDAFHGRVERAFDTFTSGDWQHAHPECGPIVAIDGRGTVDDVHERLIGALAAELPEPFARLTPGAHH